MIADKKETDSTGLTRVKSCGCFYRYISHNRETAFSMVL